MVGRFTPPHDSVLLLLLLLLLLMLLMVVVVVVVVPFWSDFAKDIWNCMRITRYVVSAPTICKIIHW
jgi:hypothetical protein